MVERRDFVDFRGRKPHFACERDHVRCGKKTVTILDFVQVLDQEIAIAGRVAQERLDLTECPGIDGPSFEIATTSLSFFCGAAFQLLSSTSSPTS
jgi:hypothetical protein